MHTKNKISLSDYQYKRDIEGRIFISNLSPEEVHILKELINLPSKFTLLELSESAEVDQTIVKQTIDKCSQIGLAYHQNQHVFVDKEIRKHFELHVHKFYNGFTPDFYFIRTLLHRVPMSLLPRWYDIPKTSDTIFDSILEKWALTPKLYEQYLQELTFDDRTMNAILQDVLTSPDLQIPAATLRERYSLTKEKYHEYVLLLEFHLALVSSFSKIESQWVEILTPIHEWKDFLQQQRNVIPLPMQNSGDVNPLYDSDFGFFSELQTFLSGTDTQCAAIAEKATLLGLFENQELLKAEAAEFMQLPFHEQVFLLYRKSIEALQDRWNSTFGPIERTIREVQKALRKLPVGEWFVFDEFSRGLLLPIGNQEPIRLKVVGKRWRYTLPCYAEKEREFVHSVIFDLLFPTGIVACGHLNDKLCFKVTSFGQVTISE